MQLWELQQGAAGYYPMFWIMKNWVKSYKYPNKSDYGV